MSGINAILEWVVVDCKAIITQKNLCVEVGLFVREIEKLVFNFLIGVQVHSNISELCEQYNHVMDSL